MFSNISKNVSAYFSWWSFCSNKVGDVFYNSPLLHFVNNLVASTSELLSPIILPCIPLTEWPSHSLAHPSYNELFTLHHAHPFRVRKTFVRIPLRHSLEILYFCKCVSWEMKERRKWGKKSPVQHLWKQVQMASFKAHLSFSFGALYPIGCPHLCCPTGQKTPSESVTVKI